MILRCILSYIIVNCRNFIIVMIAINRVNTIYYKMLFLCFINIL